MTVFAQDDNGKPEQRSGLLSFAQATTSVCLTGTELIRVHVGWPSCPVQGTRPLSPLAFVLPFSACLSQALDKKDIFPVFIVSDRGDEMQYDYGRL